MKRHMLLTALAVAWVVFTTPNSAQAQFVEGLQAPACVRVIVPNPLANVFFDNGPTYQKGTNRLFLTPLLDSENTYTYKVSISWSENGHTITRVKQVEVRAGEETLVDFTAKEMLGTPSVGLPAGASDPPLTPPIAPEAEGPNPLEDIPLTPPIASEPGTK